MLSKWYLRHLMMFQLYMLHFIDSDWNMTTWIRKEGYWKAFRRNRRTVKNVRMVDNLGGVQIHHLHNLLGFGYVESHTVLNTRGSLAKTGCRLTVFFNKRKWRVVILKQCVKWIKLLCWLLNFCLWKYCGRTGVYTVESSQYVVSIAFLMY